MPIRRIPAIVVAVAASCLAVAGCTASSGTGSAGSGSGVSNAAVDTTPASLAISPADSATSVTTSKPISVTAAHGTLTSVTATSAAGTVLTGAMTAGSTAWASTSVLAPSTTYTVTATAKSAAGKETTEKSTFSTVKPTSLVYPSVIPLNGETVGVGMVIRVMFDHPVVDKAATERLLSVTSSKPVTGSWHWFGNNEVHYRTETYWPAYDKITLHIGIGGRSLGGSVFGQTSRTISFQTGASMITYVSNATKQLKTYRNGQLVKTVPVSLGETIHPSVSGTMLVMTVEHNHIMDSSTYGVPADSPGGYRTNITWALRLTNSGQFLHSAPWSVAQQGHTNVSHGCININTAAAGWFYDNSHRGDVVIVSGTGHEIQPGDGWTDWRYTWAQWQAGSAL